MPKTPSKKLSKLCETCGEIFYPRKDRYNKIRFCSKKCADIGASKKVTIECKFCHKSILIKPSHVGKVFYCSKKCMAEDYRRRFSGENNPNYTNAGIKKCLFCGKEFVSYNKKRKYCSLDCSLHHKKAAIRTCKKCDTIVGRGKIHCDLHSRGPNNPPRPHLCKKCGVKIPAGKRYCNVHTPRQKYKRVCLFCGKEFFSAKSVRKTFCSQGCQLASYSGSGNPNYIDGRKPIVSMIRQSTKNRILIKKILHRDNFTCQKCGQVGWTLHVDHIKHFATIFSEFKALHPNEKDKQILFSKALEYPDFWNESNLRVLCKKCNLSRAKGKSAKKGDSQ